MGERDELFEEAARLIVRNQIGSTSLIQRKLALGYARSGRTHGPAGKCRHRLVRTSAAKPREVYIKTEEELNGFCRILPEKLKWDRLK
jgi:S-DNA-T family DNA segregation ATPase FtsK/SpoIIIE